MKKILVRDLFELDIIDVNKLEYFYLYDGMNWIKYHDENKLFNEYWNYKVTGIYPGDYEDTLCLDVQED